MAGHDGEWQYCDQLLHIRPLERHVPQTVRAIPCRVMFYLRGRRYGRVAGNLEMFWMGVLGKAIAMMIMYPATIIKCKVQGQKDDDTVSEVRE